MRLCHKSISDSTFCPFANNAVPPSVESRMNILPSLRPCAITRPSSSMKHPRCVNRTCIPWSTIYPTDTRFFMIVGTCNMFMSFPFCLLWLRGTSQTFAIGCGVSSSVATTPGCISFSRYESHSLSHIMWFDAPESTYHTLSEFGVIFLNKLASCLVKKAEPFPAFPDPST